MVVTLSRPDWSATVSNLGYGAFGLPFGKKIEDPEKKAKSLTAEINNGRLAMVAIIGPGAGKVCSRRLSWVTMLVYRNLAGAILYRTGFRSLWQCCLLLVVVWRPTQRLYGCGAAFKAHACLAVFNDGQCLACCSCRVDSGWVSTLDR